MPNTYIIYIKQSQEASNTNQVCIYFKETRGFKCKTSTYGYILQSWEASIAKRIYIDGYRRVIRLFRYKNNHCIFKVINLKYLIQEEIVGAYPKVHRICQINWSLTINIYVLESIVHFNYIGNMLCILVLLKENKTLNKPSIIYIKVSHMRTW